MYLSPPLSSLLPKPLSAIVQQRAHQTKYNKVANAATIPDKRALETSWKINQSLRDHRTTSHSKEKPFKILALPWGDTFAISTPLFPSFHQLGLTSIILSVSPTEAIISAVWENYFLMFSKLKVISGIWNGGKPPLTEAMSATVLYQFPNLTPIKNHNNSN
jgi:hypothetical protein